MCSLFFSLPAIILWWMTNEWKKNFKEEKNSWNFQFNLVVFEGSLRKFTTPTFLSHQSAQIRLHFTRNQFYSLFSRQLQLFTVSLHFYCSFLLFRKKRMNNIFFLQKTPLELLRNPLVLQFTTRIWVEFCFVL